METEITSTNTTIEFPVCSTDNVWYKTNMEMSSSEKFDAIDSNITSLQSRKQTQIIRMTSLQILSRR